MMPCDESGSKQENASPTAIIPEGKAPSRCREPAGQSLGGASGRPAPMTFWICRVLPRCSIQASKLAAARCRAISASVINTATLCPPGVAAVYHQPSMNDSTSVPSVPDTSWRPDSSKKTALATSRSSLTSFNPTSRDSKAERPVASTTQRAVWVPDSPQSIFQSPSSNLNALTLAAMGKAPWFSASVVNMRSNKARSKRQPVLWTSRKNSLPMSSGPPQALMVRKEGQW